MSFKYYMQCDPRWGKQDYSAPNEKTDICESGCGTTCMAMILATWLDDKITPSETTAWSKRRGFKAYKQGTYYSYFKAQSSIFGLKAYQLNSVNLRNKSDPTMHKKVKEALSHGHVVIACMGKGNWTRTGHYILLWKVDEDRDIAYVNDPASKEVHRTMGSWKLLQDEVKYYFIVENPKKGGERMENNNQVPEWGRQAWEKALQRKFFDGTRPNDSLTRVEASVVADRIINYVEQLITERLGGR